MEIKIVVIALYAAMIIWVGYSGMKKTKSFNDFFLGGGNIGPWMTAFSYGTAYFSAVLFIGFAGKIGWTFGYSGMWIALLNALVGVLFVWKFLGWKIKTMSVSYQVATMSEFLEKRYQSKHIKLLSALVIFVFMIPYSAAVFMGLSYLFTTSLGVNYGLILILMGFFTASYVIMGGYKSMAMIDMIFGIIMAASVIILLISTLNKGGGFVNITETLSAINEKLVAPVGPPGIWHLLSLVFLTSIAPLAMPQLVQKFYAIKDKKSVHVGMFASTAFALLIGFIAYFLGSTTQVFLSPEATPNAFVDGQPHFDRLMPELLTSVIPESLAVLILLLILSASMSTLASLVLISSSSFVKDFWAGYVQKDISDKRLTLLMRVMSAVFIAMAVLLAWVELDVIVEILGISWGALGAFFIGPFIWGLFSKKTTRLAAYLSGIIGLALTLTLYFVGLYTDNPVKEWYFTSPGAGSIGIMASFILAPLISIGSKPQTTAV